MQYQQIGVFLRINYFKKRIQSSKKLRIFVLAADKSARFWDGGGLLKIFDFRPSRN